MDKKVLVGIVVVVLVVGLVAFLGKNEEGAEIETVPVEETEQGVVTPSGEGSAEEGAGIANPASTNCVDKGGTLDIRTAEDGGQTGYCVFDDGTECEEWAFFRGECPVAE